MYRLGGRGEAVVPDMSADGQALLDLLSGRRCWTFEKKKKKIFEHQDSKAYMRFFCHFLLKD